MIDHHSGRNYVKLNSEKNHTFSSQASPIGNSFVGIFVLKKTLFIRPNISTIQSNSFALLAIIGSLPHDLAALLSATPKRTMHNMYAEWFSVECHKKQSQTNFLPSRLLTQSQTVVKIPKLIT